MDYKVIKASGCRLVDYGDYCIIAPDLNNRTGEHINPGYANRIRTTQPGTYSNYNRFGNTRESTLERLRNLVLPSSILSWEEWSAKNP